MNDHIRISFPNSIILFQANFYIDIFNEIISRCPAVFAIVIANSYILKSAFQQQKCQTAP